jgi:N-acetylglucosamine-6-phosphate deacetylase
MNDGWIAPDLLFNGQELLSGRFLHLRGGRVVAVSNRAEGAAIRVPGIVTPGFVDLQVNGGGGVLLNQTPTVAGMQAIAAAHRRFGTVAILPTLITDAPEVMEKAATSTLATYGRDGIIGLHIEGPHIALARRGTHAARFVRPLDHATMDVVARLRAADVPVMLTLAPEAVAEGQIAALAALGVVVSIGHSDTTADHVRTALGEGVGCFTHLFNAMSPLHHRAPGVVGAALNSHVPAGIICDGVHVADELVALAIRARPAPDLMFLVSDAMPTVGGPDRFRLYDMDLRLVDGQLVNPEGSLAGAHVTMAQSIARLVNRLGVDRAQALRMAVTIPARVIGRPDLAAVKGRAVGDLLILQADCTMTGSEATSLESLP